MKTIAVVFGGKSVEHDISIITGQFIIAALQAAGQFEVVPIYITKDGSWYSDPVLADLKFFQDLDFNDRLNRLKLPTKHLDGQFALGWSGLKSKQAKIDVVFPALHGTYGEDGSLQGLLKLANVPFVGCNQEASVIAMDKLLAKQVTAANNIMSVPYTGFTAEDWAKSRQDVEMLIQELKLPLFVKPAHLGSSIGVTRVDDVDKLEQAVEVALHYDDKVIVEQGVKDLMEVNCAVLGNETVQASLLEEPLHQAEFLNFEDKYIGGAKEAGGSMSGAKDRIKIPAPLEDDVTAKIQEMAITAFKAIGGSGTARLDFLIDKATMDVYLNEINPLPGSLQQHLWKASGVSNVELVTRLVDLAEERFAKSQRLTTTFASSVLNQSGGSKQIN